MTDNTDEPKHPIQVVTRRTGLSADVLRAWERRYEAVCPRRTGSRRRLYSDRDVERLILLKQATEAGRPIGQVAGWSNARLRELVHEDRRADAARLQDQDSTLVSRNCELCYEGALRAIERLDPRELQQVLDAASLALSPVDLTEQVLVPVMRTVGERWDRGTLGIANEHMASAIVRNALSEIVLSRRPRADGPGLVVATPPGQVHELGALVVAATAASVGWRVTYLGADLPVADIAQAVEATGSRGVALSLTYPADDPQMGPHLTGLRAALPREGFLLVGGLAAPAYAEALAGSGALLLHDTASLRAVLVSLRYEAGESAA